MNTCDKVGQLQLTRVLLELERPAEDPQPSTASRLVRCIKYPRMGSMRPPVDVVHHGELEPHAGGQPSLPGRL